jgi:hypothetical protein
MPAAETIAANDCDGFSLPATAFASGTIEPLKPVAFFI